MAKIEFKDIGHSYYGRSDNPEDYALHPMNLSWEDGKRYALLGPSGCGKTTLLNIISGLITPSDGRVLFDGKDMTPLPTEKRNIAQVFQFPVIYGTMSVYDNLAFPLRCRKLEKSEIDARVKSVADLLNLTSFLSAPGIGLTADAKQLISLGRGLVRNDVAAIMLDEPLTVVDPHLKWQLRRKLKEVNETYKQTMILVTHDQNEAMTFADKVVLMRDGQVIQEGTPRELFENPEHTFAGYFIGSPAMNFIPCTRGDNALILKGNPIPFPGLNACSQKIGKDLTLGIRPEFLRLETAPSAGGVGVDIVHASDLGSFRIVTVALEEQELKVKVPIDRPLPQDRGYLNFPGKWTNLYHQGRRVKVPA